MSKGKYIVIEGCDGSGKSTIAKLLKEALEAKGREVRIVNILKDHPASATVRSVVTGNEYSLHPDAEACLYAGAVLNTYHLVIKPLLDAGVVVISDRSFLSTLVYQGHAQQLEGNTKPMQILAQAYSGSNGIVPDTVLLMRTEPQRGLERVLQRDSGLDRIESRGVAYQEQVQDAYVDIVAEHCPEAIHLVFTNNGSIESLAQFADQMAKTIA